MARSPRVRGVPRPWAALSNPFGVVAQGPDPHKAQVVTDPGSVRGKEVPICVGTNGFIPAGQSALDKRAHPNGGDKPTKSPMTIDMEYTRGDIKGRTALGIYKIEDVLLNIGRT